jgi:beta-lactam-binding protein with PASTA domain/serine/threonine protein kinase
MSKLIMQELIGHVLGDRYVLTEILGTGASGVVYMADDLRLKRKVAVKILHREFLQDKSFLKRFRGEAQLAASLHHPNIVSVYDWGEEDFPFLVLELLEGGSLRSQLDEEITLTPPQAAHIGIQICSALEYAHTRGIIHRDIKPANLLFDEHGIVRVADFGIARALAEGSMTERSGTIIGTARYSSPELANGVNLTNRSDLYSFALVLVESVTNSLPFAADTQLGTLAARLQGNLEAPKELGPLMAVVEQAGKLKPDERYPDARTMKMALQDAARSMPKPGPITLVTYENGHIDPHPTTIIAKENSVAKIVGPGDIPVEATTSEIQSEASKADNKLYDGELDDSDLIDDSPKNRFTQKLVGLSIFAAIVLALVSVVLVLNAGGAQSKTNINYVGMLEKQAKTEAKDEGIKIKVKSVTSTDPVGVVISQTPKAGEPIAGKSVTLTISKGPKPIDVPSAISLSEEEATNLLTESGFLVVKTRSYHDEIQKGFIISTKPDPNSKAPPESTVEIIISDGKPPVAIPNVEGKPYSEGAASLSGIGLKATRVEQFSDEIDAGIIMGSDPAPGKKANVGSTIKLIVSKGPEIINVPNLVGLSIESATDKLKSLGFKVDVQNYAAGGKVRAQDPSAGAALRKGSEITLFL